MRRLVIGVIALGLLWGIVASGGFAGPDTSSGTEPPPNVVVVMADDMRFDELRYMPKTKRLLVDEGTEFATAVASYPLCCPSRATFLTGQHAHNHGVTSNKPPKGYAGLDGAETLPVWLQRAGYATAHIGKYMNGYGDAELGRSPTEVPPGYDSWQVLSNRTEYRMFDFDMNVDGELRSYGTAPQDHQTDVLSRRSAATLRRASASGRPFYLAVTPAAPHREPVIGPPRPAPRHVGAYADEPLPRPPSFNEGDVSDKSRHIADDALLSGDEVADTRTLFQARIESLLAIDDLVEQVVQTLDEAGTLDDTLIVFTSDNGFMRGEHRQPTDKFVPYEESIRVPLVIRGPGFPAGRVAGQPVSNVDTAATIIEATGARPGLLQDGRPLQPVARDPGLDRERSILIEAGPSPGEVGYVGVRTPDWVFVRYETGEEELYDLRADPYQLEDLAGLPSTAAQRAELDAEVRRLQHCAGAACR
jgi:arylsulfatase A-like enzyme